MTVRTGIFVLVVAASAAWAQNPGSTINGTRRLAQGTGATTEQRRGNAANQPELSGSDGQAAKSTTHLAGNSSAKKAVQNAPATPAASSVKPAKAAGLAKSSAPKKTRATLKRASVQPGVSKPPESDATQEPGTDQAGVHTMRGHRDPFQTVIRAETVEAGCANGKKCLDVNKIDLKGIVRSQSGMIAVVENQQRKTYFLHENDPVFKGHVVKINPDSVVFQQIVVDKVGKQSTRDVVKRLFGSAV